MVFIYGNGVYNGHVIEENNIPILKLVPVRKGRIKRLIPGEEDQVHLIEATLTEISQLDGANFFFRGIRLARAYRPQSFDK